jgi:hypothetical protein
LSDENASGDAELLSALNTLLKMLLSPPAPSLVLLKTRLRKVS